MCSFRREPLCGVMISELASSEVYREFDPNRGNHGWLGILFYISILVREKIASPYRENKTIQLVFGAFHINVCGIK